ncbi:PREDICTED: egg cell-secreted protein 1.1 [Prunus mume]|uniref:Egg cell-secreted protein 1.1 n=1 Tax=Prunus mume TaxID=102107 RepID=A0ABM1LSY7_PRUMU|nr:PREDICTED: egg cell-secreted protein 1.1 [Prunus mume]
MAAYTTFKLFLPTALLDLAMPFLATSARPLNSNIIQSNLNLAAMLNLDEESSNCWESLFQLQACSGEVVMFFKNGFTVEENDVLKGYCDEAIHVKSHTSNPPSPPSSHDPTNVFTTLHPSLNILLSNLD